MTMQIVMILRLAFQYSMGDLLPDMRYLPGFCLDPARLLARGVT
jgi:hypothetical protein